VPALVSRRAPDSARMRSRTVRAMADRMLRSLSIETAELSVLLTDDSAIRSLNRDFRRQDSSTDVLAFPLEEAEPGHRSTTETRVLGDVVISLDTAQRQAGELGHSLQHELMWLLAHGLLHLLGYDHETAADRRRMDEMTKRLVEAATGGAAPTSLPDIGQRARRYR
jgi:probable rRNA maturation factor